MFGPIFLLPGDSDANWGLPQLLKPKLPGLFSEWTAAAYTFDVDRRLEMLDALVPRGEPARRVVLFGRSSGARVASVFATRREVGAVICVSYPFRRPNRCLEPARFEHLARISVPTLIIQGSDDEYGGLDVTEHYALSAAVSVRIIDGDHVFDLPPAELEVVARLIRSFCDAVSRGIAMEPGRFDETYYLRTHVRALRDVAAGRYRSGEEHYRVEGRAEGLGFRLLPEQV